jgi:hypothetical protein
VNGWLPAGKSPTGADNRGNACILGAEEEKRNLAAGTAKTFRFEIQPRLHRGK